MSALVDAHILEELERGGIAIDPFDRGSLGTNSYDVHLAPTLRVYRIGPDCTSPPRFGGPPRLDAPLDVRAPCETLDVEIPESGFVLEPGELYLASTVERIDSKWFLPVLNGRSSLGRLGLSIHVTAGTGDVGFCGVWTMELFVIKRLRVYAGIPIGQMLWFEVSGEPIVRYGDKATAKYQNSGALPQASKLHEELNAPRGR